MAKKKIPEGMENALPNVTSDELAASRKASAAMPSWGEIKTAFGEDAVATRKINLDPKTPDGLKNRGKLLDMMMPAWQAEADRGMKFSERMEKKILYDKQGRRRVAPAEMADRIARHRDDRGAHWATVEAPVELAAAIRTECREDRVLLIGW